MSTNEEPGTRLDWSFDQQLNCEVAFYNGYRIKAVRDDYPENPFEAWDGLWPMIVSNDGYDTTYDKHVGVACRYPLHRFNDHQLVHDQVALAQLLRFSGVRELMESYATEEPVKYCRDADVLRDAIGQALDDIGNKHDQLKAMADLYEILGIPCLLKESRGYCQGDYAYVLVAATPEAQAALRSKPDDMDDEAWAKELAKDMAAQVDLYSAWAWGDVYGYIVERPVLDEDGDVIEWEDAGDHNSCWGFYGTDHRESGLEEAALDAVPDEPAVPACEREDA